MREYNAAADLIDRHVAAGRGEKNAFVDDTATLSYAALAERVARAAAALRTLGVEPEQRVAMCMLDTIDFPCIFWGALRAGIAPVPLNTLLTTDEYAYMLGDSRARIVVASDALCGRLAP